MLSDIPFKNVVLLDTEFYGLPGNRQIPVCMVLREWRTGETIRLWQDDLQQLSECPFPVDSDSCYVAYYSSAEWNTFLALGWPLPVNVIDFYVEFRCLTNDLLPFGRAGFIDALNYFRIPSIGHAEKTEMRDLILTGGPWDAAQKTAILDYCESDVQGLADLYPYMMPRLDLPMALLRGRFMPATARMEWLGIPIDTEGYERLSSHWERIQEELIHRINWDFYCVYDGKRFRSRIWEWYLIRNGISWPRTPTGKLDLKQETFESMLRLYPQIEPIYNLRNTIGKMRLRNIAVGSDGRNRTLLSPFRSRTSRTQPSSAKFILGSAAWMRGLIQPTPGRALAYVDYSQEEFAIAAALSQDTTMQEAYLSGDPYLSLAKLAGYVPPHATKETHARERGIYKECCLAIQYGLGPANFANKIGTSPVIAEALLQSHRNTFRKFWAWSDDVVRYAMIHGRLWSVFGWYRHYRWVREQSARNFCIQAAGAEILRLAIIHAQAAGVQVLAPLHDALLIESDIGHIEEVAGRTQRVMKRAGEQTLKGFPLRTETKLILSPERYMEPRGQAMWDLVWNIVRAIEQGNL